MTAVVLGLTASIWALSFLFNPIVKPSDGWLEFACFCLRSFVATPALAVVLWNVGGKLPHHSDRARKAQLGLTVATMVFYVASRVYFRSFSRFSYTPLGWIIGWFFTILCLATHGSGLGLLSSHRYRLVCARSDRARFELSPSPRTRFRLALWAVSVVVTLGTVFTLVFLLEDLCLIIEDTIDDEH